MPLSADDIRAAFAALSQELERDGERAEIVVAGGAALVMLYEARKGTKDVDAVFVAPEAAVVRRSAERVADRLGLPSDWLNDGAKGYFVGISRGDVLFATSSLSVRSASIAQLLAMKLAAWRDAVDRSDAKLLLSRLPGDDKDEIWGFVEPFVSRGDLNKASYAFDDLWEALHGT